MVTLRDEDMDVDRITVEELKAELTSWLQLERSKPYFFFDFANGALHSAFIGFEFSTRTVDQTCAQSALFPDEQDPAARLDESQCCMMGGRPIRPVNRVDSCLLAHGSPLCRSDLLFILDVPFLA